ncbi:hypothetical protein FFI16_023475 [Pseudomonas sp. KBS0710]|nr:hypothetical protein FFI16_023475 [Pseudomonas sp. KBS0710]
MPAMAGNSVCLINRGVCIAGQLPQKGRSHRKAALQCMQIRSRHHFQSCIRSTVGAGLLANAVYQ